MPLPFVRCACCALLLSLAACFTPHRPAPVANAARNTGKAAPLLTDRRTAAALNVPHTILPSGVALVSNPPPMLGGGITVLRSAPAPVIAATVAQPAPQRRDTVITELHNPPLTVIQQGGMVVSALR